MWLFLFTELILFGGLFIVYAVYRYSHPSEFHLAAQELDTFVGTVNTIILLTSSLTVAMSITALQEGRKGIAILLVTLTLILALSFLSTSTSSGGTSLTWASIPVLPNC